MGFFFVVFVSSHNLLNPTTILTRKCVMLSLHSLTLVLIYHVNSCLTLHANSIGISSPLMLVGTTASVFVEIIFTFITNTPVLCIHRDVKKEDRQSQLIPYDFTSEVSRHSGRKYNDYFNCRS